MMNYVYSAHDDDGDRFCPPYISANDTCAFKSFCFLYDIANSHVGRLSLFRIGVFNDETGCLEPFDPVDISEELNKFISTSFHNSLVEMIMNELVVKRNEQTSS